MAKKLKKVKARLDALEKTVARLIPDKPSNATGSAKKTKKAKVVKKALAKNTKKVAGPTKAGRRKSVGGSSGIKFVGPLDDG